MALGRLIPFLVLSFGLTWGLAIVMVLFTERVEALFGPLSMTNPLFLLAVYSPAIAGLLLVLREAGWPGLSRFLRRLLIWRVHVGWYLLALAAPPLLMTVAAGVGEGLQGWSYAYTSVGALLAALTMTLLIGPVEEFGWRGLMLPLLQQRYTPFAAGLMVGAVWTLWHVPAFLLSGTPQSGFDFLPFVLGTMSISMIMTVMFNATAGSLLLPVLMHFQLNNPITPDGQPLDAIAFLLLAVALIWWQRGAMFARTGYSVVIPRAGRETAG